MSTTRPPVNLVGIDSNAFMILGACLKAAKKAGMTKEWQDTFMNEAKSGDYDHLLQTAIKYFDVEAEEEGEDQEDDEEEETCGECGCELNSIGECDDCEDDAAEEDEEES